jgi:hypothetical protein
VFCYLCSQFVGVLVVKIFILCFVTSVNTKQRILQPELPQIENGGSKTQNKDF